MANKKESKGNPLNSPMFLQAGSNTNPLYLRVVLLDISRYNASAGVLPSYATFAAALAAVPAQYHLGGLAVRFINSVTEQYEQYRLLSPEWSTTESDWVQEDVVDATISSGSPGQILALDGNGKPTWVTVQQGMVVVDNSLSEVSQNPVENRVITGALSQLGQKVDDINSIVVNTQTINTEVGVLIKESGAVDYGLSQRRTSDFVPFSSDLKIYNSFTPSNTSVYCMVCVYDSEKSLVAAINGEQTDTTYSEFIIRKEDYPTGSYIRYSLASDSLDCKVSELKTIQEKFVEIDNAIDELSGNEELVFVAEFRTTGGFIDKDTGEFTNTGVSASYVDTFLNITGGASYKICGRVGSNTQTCLGAFYDENGNFISSFSPSGGITTEIYDFSVTAPDNARTIKVYGNTTDAVQASVSGSVKSTAENLQKQINRDGLVSFVKVSRITGGFIDKDTGDFTNTGVSNSYVDTFVNITPGGEYIVSGRVGSNTQTCLGAFYDAYGTFISSFNPSGGITTEIYNFVVTAPNNASILKVYGNVTDDVQATVIGSIKTIVANITKQIQKLNFKNYGKSVGVFGGSFSVYPESQVAKNIWRNKLGVTITDYGVSGAGFSSLQGTSIQTQVDGAGVHDIYIIWASTNDFTNSRDCGTWEDYTALDNYDSSKLTTQCGGINYCIKKLLTINPSAEIYFFTSLRFFTMESGYNPFSTQTNSTGKTFREYVEAQKQCCEYYGIPLLDQYNIQGVNAFNYTNYYKDDNLHMKEEGYRKIGWTQAEFLANGE